MEAVRIPGNGWIWIPSWDAEDEKLPEFVYFRKVIEFQKVPESFAVKVSADSRYKLYINGQFIVAGPSKGDEQVWFFDEIDIKPYLQDGKNVLAVVVLRYPPYHRKGNYGIFRTKTPGFYLQSLDTGTDGRPILQADNSWKCKKAGQIQIISENPYFAPLQIYERAKGVFAFFNWMLDEYNDEEWEYAYEYNLSSMSAHFSPGNLQARTIPLLILKERCFCSVMRIQENSIAGKQWEKFLAGNKAVVIPEYSDVWVEISAGELMTGYLKLELRGGKGSRISLLQSESYAEKPKHGGSCYEDFPVKKDRSDCENGMLFGFTDEYMVGGMGTRQYPETYEPFWFRTFRYIRINVHTEKEPLTLSRLSYLETGYPLEIRSEVKTSDESLSEIWDICARTLKRCMHETYEDCPFYEQLQYAMDSRSQILYTYAVSADDRLARRCMDDFRRSRRFDGMINCSYPNFEANIIPGFSIYYVGMLVDHMMYFGDRELIRYHMPVVDGITEYFRRNLDERGIVGKVGDLNRPGNYWSFIDWTQEWDATSGVPAAALKGPITMESLLYILGLQYAARLNEFIGRAGMAQEYWQRAVKVQEALRRTCMGSNGMVQDGPGVEEYSQHCQVFAVLTDTVTLEVGKELLLETLEHKEKYAQCSIAMMFYLFRALEKCGLYEKTEHLWDIWRNMIADHMTTCAEDSVHARSDCHAWGALALYELPAVVLGVRPFKPGCKEICVNPIPGALDWAEGNVVTPKGDIYVKWKKEKGKLVIEIQCPADMNIFVPDQYTDVKVIRVSDKENYRK